MPVRLSQLLKAAFSIAAVLSLSVVASAQTQTPNNNGGVEIDANGVLNLQTQLDPGGILDRQQSAAARQNLTQEIQRPSSLRKVSLTRLEAEVAKRLAAGLPLPDDMLQLAGLTRITHVFFYPETKDIVVAGPAEGFYKNGANRVVGLNTGAATLHLEDLVVALRAFGPDGEKTGVISCSIDPTQEGLTRMKQAVQNVQGNFRPGSELQVVQLYQEALGLQEITVEGIAAETRMARVLVEADYMMKLIGIGLIQPPVAITSFIAAASPTAVAQNSLQRWFFQPNYECVQVNADRSAMQLVGSGVKLVGEDERVSRDGERQGTGKANPASREFCSTFTREYENLSQIMPVFAELRNVVDLTIAAAFIQKADLYAKAGWEMTTFSNEEILPTERFNAPRHVAPAINAVWKGQYFMTPIGGGVNIQPRVALNSDRLQEEKDGSITTVRDSISLAGLAEGQWWWD
jgi:Protein of unknown function (DUF1598)